MIPANFTAEIIDFQRIHNRTEIGHRNTDDGIAFAKVISYNEQSDYSQAIFINDAFIKALFNKELANDIIHYIQHELGHVHDNFKTRHIFVRGTSNEERRLQDLLQDHSENIWSEYIANRCSYLTASPKIMAAAIDNVLDNVESVTNNIKDYINNYQQNGNKVELINCLSKSTDLLFYYTAHAFGFLHALKEQVDDSDTPDIDKEVLSRLTNTFYHDIWVRIGESLLTLHNDHPNWKSNYKLNGLNEAILLCWLELGVSISITSNDFAIKILNNGSNV